MLHVSVQLRAPVRVLVSLKMHACMHACMYVWMYVRDYVYTNTHVESCAHLTNCLLELSVLRAHTQQASSEVPFL